MKRTFKFTMAALAAFALASCSSDDLFNSGKNAKLDKDALIVEVEDMVDAVTLRSAYVPDEDANTATLFWQSTDQIRVLDETMIKYDLYAFNANEGIFKLTGKTDKNLEEVKYALFTPNVKRYYYSDGQGGWYTRLGDDFGPYGHSWDYYTNSVYVDTYINNYWILEEDNQAAGKGTVAYKSYLPMWGTAENVGDNVKVSLKYLTAILRVDLKNVRGNASYVRVQAWEDQAGTIETPLAGVFRAYITEDGELNEEAALDPNNCRVDDGNTIEVYIGSAQSENTTVLIPLLAQKYGKLVVSVMDDNTNQWEEVKIAYNQTFERKKFYKVSVNEFDFKGETVSDINATLAQHANDTEDVTLTAKSENTAMTKVVNYNTVRDNELIIPAMKAETVTINLNQLSDPYYINGNAILNINGAFKGTLVLDLAEASTDWNTNAKVSIDLAGADVVLKGEGWKNVSLGGVNNQGEWEEIPVITKSLTIAPADDDDETTEFASVNLNKESAGDVVLGEGTVVGALNIEEGTKVKSITVEGTISAGGINAAQSDKMDIELTIGGSAEINGDIKTNQKELEISGKAEVTGNVTAKKAVVAVKDKATVGGQVDATGLEISGESASVAWAHVTGDVTIALTKEGVAVAQTLHIDNAKDGDATLTLSGGYINKLQSTKKINIVNSEVAQTAIADASALQLKDTYTSKWCGKAIKVADYAAYATADIYTASQLASLTANATTLKCNVDLDSQAWTPLELKANFNGNGKTISNLNVNVKADNAGLFSKVAGNVEITNLTINNATVTNEKNNTGILFGKAEQAVGVRKVKLTGENTVTGSKNTSLNVGGLAGYAAHLVATDDTITVKTVKGQFNVGGLVGIVSIADISKLELTVSGFAQTNPSAKVDLLNGGKNVEDAGSFGTLFGRVGKTTVDPGTVTANPIKVTATGYDRNNLGFKAKGKVVDEPQTDGSKLSHAYYYYGTKENYLGLVDGGTIKIANKSYTQAPADIKTAATLPAEKYGIMAKEVCF